MVETVALSLSDAEALVLFELLARVGSASRVQLEDDSERMVLWSIQAQLERSLVAPFAADDADRLARAREQVRATQ